MFNRSLLLAVGSTLAASFFSNALFLHLALPRSDALSGRDLRLVQADAAITAILAALFVLSVCGVLAPRALVGFSLGCVVISGALALASLGTFITPSMALLLMVPFGLGCAVWNSRKTP